MIFTLDNKIFDRVPEKNRMRALLSHSLSEILYITFAYFLEFCV